MDATLLQLTPGAYETVALTDGAAHGLTAAKIDPPIPGSGPPLGPAAAAVISPEGNQIRWRVDGGTPEAAVGIPLAAGDLVSVVGHQALKNFKAIKTGGTTVVLHVQYYHW